MSWQLVAQGNVIELPNLVQYEGQIEEGSKCLLELDLTIPVTQGVADELETQLINLGVEGVSVATAQMNQ